MFEPCNEKTAAKKVPFLCDTVHIILVYRKSEWVLQTAGCEITGFPGHPKTLSESQFFDKDFRLESP